MTILWTEIRNLDCNFLWISHDKEWLKLRNMTTFTKNWGKTLFINLSFSHCSRITRYINFIALDIFHLPTFKYDVDNLNWLKKPNSHGEFLRKSKIFKKGNFFIEFCIINMQKWSNFMKESIKYSRILWNLKQILQYSQKHSPKGHMVKLFSDVTKNLFYDKSCVFSKNSTCI